MANARKINKAIGFDRKDIFVRHPDNMLRSIVMLPMQERDLAPLYELVRGLLEINQDQCETKEYKALYSLMESCLAVRVNNNMSNSMIYFPLLDDDGKHLARLRFGKPPEKWEKAKEIT